MLAALESCGEVLVKFGGHKQAAGLTMETARIRELRARVNDFADGCLHPDDLRPRLCIDGPRRVKDRHLKMAFKQDGRVMRGIAWRALERETFVTEHRDAIDLAFSLEQDTWNGERYLQLSVADF